MRFCIFGKRRVAFAFCRKKGNYVGCLEGTWKGDASPVKESSEAIDRRKSGPLRRHGCLLLEKNKGSST